MPKVCVKVVEGLFKLSAQVKKLSTKSTVGYLFSGLVSIISTALPTYFAQFYCALTQAYFGIFNQLSVWLCPLSTIPMNTTNLIKE